MKAFVSLGSCPFPPEEVRVFASIMSSFVMRTLCALKQHSVTRAIASAPDIHSCASRGVDDVDLSSDATIGVASEKMLQMIGARRSCTSWGRW